MSGTFPSPELYSELNKLYNSPLCSQSLSFWMHVVYAVDLFRGKFGGEFLSAGASCATGPSGFRNAIKPQSWELWLPPGVLQRFLQPFAYFAKPKSLSSDPDQSLCFISFLFLFSFSLPVLSQPVFFRYFIPLAHPCPILLSQLF